MVDNFQIVFYTAVFIVPGYILYSTLESLVPRAKPDAANIVIKFLTATLIHYIIWSWLIYLMFNNKLFITNKLIFFISAIFIVVLSPSLLGLVIAKLNDKKIIISLLQIMGYSPINPIPTAWDYKFSKMPATSWVIISLVDGKVFYGKFSTNSYASSEPTERDMYIEDVYLLDENGRWVRRERNNGVLINGEQIKYIEFF